MPRQTTYDIKDETRIIAKLMQEQRENEDWVIRLEIDRVPTGTGHYAIYDGLEVRAGGVTHNMRKAIQECTWFGRLKRPIFLFKFDLDGSAASWLNHDNVHRPGRTAGQSV